MSPTVVGLGSVDAEDVALYVECQLMNGSAEDLEVARVAMQADDEKVRIDALDNADDGGDFAALGKLGVNGDSSLCGVKLRLVLQVFIEGAPFVDEKTGDVGS